MNLKNRLIGMPVVGSLGKRIIDKWRDKFDERIINKLGRIPHPVAKMVQEILINFNNKRLNNQQWAQRIETERERLLKNSAPLVDGSFGEEGIYDEDKTIQEVCQASRDSQSALFLYLITRCLKPMNVIELGTNIGISSAYIASALSDIENEARLITLDASPYRQKLAKEIHQNIELKNIEYIQGLFYDTLDSALKEIGKIDLAFIDGHHQYQPTLDYFEQIFPYSKPGSVFIFDDIRYSQGMKRAWAELRSNKRFDLVIDLKNLGLCVCSENKDSQRFIIPTIHNVLQSAEKE